VVERVCQEVLILHDSAVVASNSVTRLRELTQAASLEEAFAAVSIDQDVVRIGQEIADVATL
jgi:ABC-type Na+ transport system ATPase subunit NatA